MVLKCGLSFSFPVLLKHVIGQDIEVCPKENKNDILKAFSLFQIKSRAHNDILMKDSHETKR